MTNDEDAGVSTKETEVESEIGANDRSEVTGELEKADDIEGLVNATANSEGEVSDAEEVKEVEPFGDDVDFDGEVVQDLGLALQETRIALETAQKQAEEHLEQLLRTRAEFDNFRKRSERDVQNARKFAIEKFAQELLSVKDSLEMGLTASEAENQHGDKLKEGVDLTLKLLTSIFEKFEIKEINPLGESFDPEFHEAMSMAESQEHAPNSVMLVYQKGYTLNDRLIRPAKVVVSKAP